MIFFNGFVFNFLFETATKKFEVSSFDSIHEYFLTKETGEVVEDDEALRINSTEKLKRISINEGINIKLF